jgi:hypothetical protein
MTEPNFPTAPDHSIVKPSGSTETSLPNAELLAGPGLGRAAIKPVRWLLLDCPPLAAAVDRNALAA